MIFRGTLVRFWCWDCWEGRTRKSSISRT